MKKTTDSGLEFESFPEKFSVKTYMFGAHECTTHLSTSNV